MSELLYLLACYGLTFVVCDATLFSRPRQWVRKVVFIDKMLACYFCTGFWTSMVVTLTEYRTFVDGVWPDIGIWVAMQALAGASFCYGFNTLVLWLEGSRPLSLTDLEPGDGP